MCKRNLQRSERCWRNTFGRIEESAADGVGASGIYLKEVADSTIYIGLLGNEYGYEDTSGFSPTELEYEAAGKYNLQRWLYIKGVEDVSHDV